MRALVLTSPGEFEIQTVAVPRPGPHEVLCKVGAVAICGSDPEIVRGDLAGTWPPAYPFTPGHEWAGEVVADRPGVVDLAPGDRVAGQAHCGCGTCANCMEGRYTICENYGRPEAGHRHYGFITTGAYAQYAVLSVKSVNRMPASMSSARARWSTRRAWCCTDSNCPACGQAAPSRSSGRARSA